MGFEVWTKWINSWKEELRELMRCVKMVVQCTVEERKRIFYYLFLEFVRTDTKKKQHTHNTQIHNARIMEEDITYCLWASNWMHAIFPLTNKCEKKKMFKQNGTETETDSKNEWNLWICQKASTHTWSHKTNCKKQRNELKN